ncbi:hypothetical protein BD626DRAFT_568893 [Schizophyllum amplum]|uniref:Uncharacterized protein n=1 Tax=Schizophyllum amplum TaxID=97359 RepID=A0A550CFB7_9AGAR|nr:hypothetical protein BD626DRAFT_568893 [Auriculariopsis ampla]
MYKVTGGMKSTLDKAMNLRRNIASNDRSSSKSSGWTTLTEKASGAKNSVMDGISRRRSQAAK